MRRLLTASAVAALALTLAASAQAGGGKPGGHDKHGQAQHGGRHGSYGHDKGHSSRKFTGQKYGDPNRPGGQHGPAKGIMPSFSSLPDSDIQAVVAYERDKL